jgi:hypothetical protein
LRSTRGQHHGQDGIPAGSAALVAIPSPYGAPRERARYHAVRADRPRPISVASPPAPDRRNVAVTTVSASGHLDCLALRCPQSPAQPPSRAAPSRAGNVVRATCRPRCATIAS